LKGISIKIGASVQVSKMKTGFICLSTVASGQILKTLYRIFWFNRRRRISWL